MATLQSVAPATSLRLSSAVYAEFVRTSAVISVLPFPVFYWVTWNTPTVFLVALAHVVVIAVCLVALRAGRRVEIRLTREGAEERGFFGRVVAVPRAEVSTVILNQIYEPQGAEYHRNLFALNARHQVMLRMRGQFWSRAQMEQVAGHLSRNVQKRSDQTTLDEIRRSSPEWLYWFERLPRLFRGHRDHRGRTAARDLDPD